MDRNRPRSSRLPEPVQRNGVQTKKASPTILIAVFLYSPDGSRDPLFVSNYATGRVGDVLKRIEGIGDINEVGARQYSMRVWLDPERAASFNIAPSEILAAIRSQNTQIAGGHPVVYAGTARFDSGEMAWWSNYSGTYQPIAAFRAQAGLPENKFVPWQKLQMGGTAMQRGIGISFLARRHEPRPIRI